MSAKPSTIVADPACQKNWEWLSAVGAVPDPGDLKPTARATAPAGWLLCDGSAVNRTAFKRLFDAIGTTYGVGDGSTTFNLPDLRGRVPMGAGTAVGAAGATAHGLGTTGGEEAHVLSTPEMPSHTHPPASGTFFLETNNTITVANGAAQFALSTIHGATGPAGGGGAHNNLQPFTAMNWLVRT